MSSCNILKILANVSRFGIDTLKTIVSCRLFAIIFNWVPSFIFAQSGPEKSLNFKSQFVILVMKTPFHSMGSGSDVFGSLNGMHSFFVALVLFRESHFKTFFYSFESSLIIQSAVKHEK